MEAKRILLASPQMQSVAEEICRRDTRISLGEISWKRFPDTWPNTFTKQFDLLQRSDVALLVCFDKPEVVFEQMGVIYQLAKMAPKSLRILLPYFTPGTMERSDQEGQVISAETLAIMLSAIAPAGPGPVPLYIWDIHALSIRSFFGKNISPRFKTGMKVLKQRIAGMENVKVVFPDKGAWDRFKSMFHDEDGKPLFALIRCDKDRGEGADRTVTIVSGDPKGCHCVIIDDIDHTGGTKFACQEALMAAGALEVSSFSTHGVMEKGAWQKFARAGFSHVWITETCPETVETVRGIKPFEVLSLVQSMTNAILA